VTDCTCPGPCSKPGCGVGWLRYASAFWLRVGLRLVPESRAGEAVQALAAGVRHAGQDRVHAIGRLGKADQLEDGVVLGAPDVEGEQSVSDLPRMEPVR
jgi:hypothetical protein